MKDRKKRRGTKAEIRAYKKRLQHIATIVTVAVLVAIIAISGFLIYSHLNPSSNHTTSPTSKPKAAIVDQLSTAPTGGPNQTFIQTATNTLEKAGYVVDYHPGENVTVEFYRNLPTHNYSLIVFRVHSGLELGKYPPLCLFTSEPYQQGKHFWEELDDRLTSVAYSEEEAKKGNLYYGITPKFVRQDMGKFQDTTIIMMGCNGLTFSYMAEAFIEQEAKVYISWSLAVSASHTDKATAQLLQHLVTQKQKIDQAVAETNEEVGLEPINNSTLLYFPREAGEHTCS